MVEGGDDGRAGMTGGWEWRMGRNGGWRGSAEGGILTDAVALRSPSFPRKRESRGLCDGKAGIGRAALGSWSPVGVGDELRGMM